MLGKVLLELLKIWLPWERLEIERGAVYQKPLSIRFKTLKDLSVRNLLEEYICPGLRRSSPFLMNDANDRYDE